MIPQAVFRVGRGARRGCAAKRGRDSTLADRLLRAARFASVFLLGMLVEGCYNPSIKIDGRAALEQQLSRVAIARAIENLAIPAAVLEGQWRIVVSAPDPKDESWIETYLQAHLNRQGAEIRP